MTTYTTINNNEVDADSPITESLLTRLRDNPIAITEAATNAPTFSSNAFANGCVTSNSMAANSVGSSEIAANAVHQSHLSTSTGELTRSQSSNYGHYTLPGGQYGYWPNFKHAGSGGFWSQIHQSVGTLPTDYTTKIMLYNNESQTYYCRQRYINSSPPYNIGNGDIAHFIYAQIDNTAGNILGTYAADAPPWAYNGPTDIRADFYDKQTKPWRFKKTGNSYTKLTGNYDTDILELQSAIENRRKLEELIKNNNDWSQLTDHIEPITHEIKNADMPLIPQPMTAEENTTVVLINPTCALVDDLALLAEEGQSIANLLHKKHIIIGNDALNVAAPPGVKVVNAKWKNSGLNND